MEKLAAQPQHEQAKQKSFDILASVDMMSADIAEFGQVLPETRQRVLNEELSFLSEGVNRAARTDFVLKRDGDELVYFDHGEYKPYMSTLYTGLKVAEREAGEDPRRQFLADRAVNDIKDGYKMRDLKPGERHIWFSPYAHAEHAKYGGEFMDSCGLVSERKMGFIYYAQALDDGSVLLESQTVDASDQDAFDAAMATYEQDPEADLDDGLAAYDQVMSDKYGGKFFAGRRDEELKQNAWEFIKKQHDLIKYQIDGLEAIAQSATSMPRYQLERITKEHIYGIWATFKTRLDNSSATAEQTSGNVTYLHASQASQMAVAREVNRNFTRFVDKGEVMVGCGGSISMLTGEDDILNASVEDVFSSIFGRGSASSLEKKVGKISKGKCVVETCPTRPGEVKVGGCGVCIDRCQELFDKGKDPTKMGFVVRKAGKQVAARSFAQEKPKLLLPDKSELAIAA